MASGDAVVQWRMEQTADIQIARKRADGKRMSVVRGSRVRQIEEKNIMLSVRLLLQISQNGL